MGQYHFIVNVTKGQFLHPHKLGDGLKLMEFACSAPGTMAALAILLADSNGRGSGDLRATSDLIGSWAGDRIVVAGDYGDKGQLYGYGAEGDTPRDEDGDEHNLASLAKERFEDISLAVRAVLEQDLGEGACGDRWDE